MSSDADKPEAKVFKFGEESLSDVVFVVDGNEFHCHRMVLAARYPYFATMFNSDFKEKTEKRIKIEADPMAFKRLLEILYNGIFEDHERFFNQTLYPYDHRLYVNRYQALWSESCALFELADRFLVLDIVRKAFESYMVLAIRRCCGATDCYMCAVKLLLSLRFQMNDFKDICKATRISVFHAIENLDPIEMECSWSNAAMKFLLNRS